MRAPELLKLLELLRLSVSRRFQEFKEFKEFKEFENFLSSPERLRSQRVAGIESKRNLVNWTAPFLKLLKLRKL